MSLDMHTVSVIDGSVTSRTDRVLLALLPASAFPAGSGAGASVSANVVLNLPANYAVHCTPSQDAVVFVSNKTQTGFTVTLNPRLAANTLAAGTVDIMVLA